jgi:hypothetical protein
MENLESQKINFISADNGGISLHYKELGVRKKLWGNTAEQIANALTRVGTEDSIYHSSSMDFASEDGFKNDDEAWDLWESAVDLYKKAA